MYLSCDLIFMAPISDNVDKLEIKSMIESSDSQVEKKTTTHQTALEYATTSEQKNVETNFEISNFDNVLNQYKSQIEAGHSFKDLQEQLKKEVESGSVRKEDADKIYDEITKRTDKTLGDKALSSLESLGDKMGLVDKLNDKRNRKNTLKRAGGAVAGWWLVKKIKGRFSKKDKKEDDKEKNDEGKKKERSENSKKKNRWQRNRGWLVGGTAVAGAATGAAYIWRDKLHKIPLIGTALDNLINPQKVSFENSYVNFLAEIKGDKMEDHFGINPHASYQQLNNDKVTLSTYGNSITIDKTKRTIEGLKGVKFRNYKELLHAANIINFCGSSFRGMCKSAQPFEISNFGGDVEVHLLDQGDKEVVSGSGFPIGKFIGGGVASLTTILGAYYGKIPGLVGGAVVGAGAVAAGHELIDKADTLSKICPTLNNSANKQNFVALLNTLPGLTQGDQAVEDINKHPLQVYIEKVKDELKEQKIESDFDKHGNARYLQAEQDSKDPTKYTIRSWKRYLGPVVVYFRNNRIKIEGIDGIDFDPTEGVRITNLTNKIKSEYAGKLRKKDKFVYRGGLSTLGYPGLYAGTTDWKFGSGSFGEYRIIKKSTLQQYFPTLESHIESHYIAYLEKLRNEDNKSLRR